MAVELESNKYSRRRLAGMLHNAEEISDANIIEASMLVDALKRALENPYKKDDLEKTSEAYLVNTLDSRFYFVWKLSEKDGEGRLEGYLLEDFTNNSEGTFVSIRLADIEFSLTANKESLLKLSVNHSRESLAETAGLIASAKPADPNFYRTLGPSNGVFHSDLNLDRITI
jgi:hypothetical protein